MAIIGIADESETHAGAEKLAAVIVPDFAYLKQEGIANSKEAIRHALDNLGRELPEYQRVRDYIIRVEPLPRTATNKVKRFQLKKEIESGEIATEAKETKTWELTGEDKAQLATSTAKSVVAAIRQNAKDGDVIHPKMNLEIDLGLDSLGRAEMFAALEQAFQTEFVPDEAATALTVANVIELVNQHGGEDMEAVSVDLNWNKILNESDDDLPEVQAVLSNHLVFSVFAFTVYKIFNLFCRVFMRLEVSGLENLAAATKSSPPYEGGVAVASADGVLSDAIEENHPTAKAAPLLRKEESLQTFLICPNHQSFLDPFVLTSNYPYRIFKNSFHVGASEFFEGGFMKAVARMMNVVPINPDTELMRAMKAGAIGLCNGKILNIYPEGERAFDGELHEFKKGAAILATELDLPIVPVALDGLQNVWARKSWKIRPAKVKIRIGKPFYAKDVVGSQQSSVNSAAAGSKPGAVATGLAVSNDDKYAVVTAHLKQTIVDMIDEMRK